MERIVLSLIMVLSYVPAMGNYDVKFHKKQEISFAIDSYTEVPNYVGYIDYEIPSQEDILCLAENVYFEARGESSLGQIAVAWVTINRVKSNKYPNTVCGVVWQPHQFSWTNSNLRVYEARAWRKAKEIAINVLHYMNSDQFNDPTNGATHYHADYIKPYWSDSYIVISKIDSHIFYK